MATPMLPRLNHAALTHPGQRRLANEDAWSIDARLGVFTVCDGVGGRPSGEAASQLVAHGFPHLLRRRLRTVREASPEAFLGAMSGAAVALSENLLKHSHDHAVLRGMAATLVTALVDASCLYLINVGDSRAYLLREGALQALTSDDTEEFRQIETQAGEQRRLLTQILGVRVTPRPNTVHLPLHKGDRLLLCSDGLTDPVSDDIIKSILEQHDQPQAAAHHLVDEANAKGGPDNITVAVIDYQGPRPIEDEDRKTVSRHHEVAPGDAPDAALNALAHLERDLTWLLEGATELATLSPMQATVAVKRRLGSAAYHEFLARHPGDNPVHVFHQANATPGSNWRGGYEKHLRMLERPLAQLTNQRTRLSPLLYASETSLILKQLWNGWRQVEARYFRTCNRSAIHASERTLNKLITHMLESARTIASLIDLFPYFMRKR